MRKISFPYTIGEFLGDGNIDQVIACDPRFCASWEDISGTIEECLFGCVCCPC